MRRGALAPSALAPSAVGPSAVGPSALALCALALCALALCALALISGCGGGVTTAPEPAAPPPSAARSAAPEASLARGAPVRQGEIARPALDAVLEGGIGRFLQHLVTEPHLEAGRFVGFRLVELDEALFAGTDLAVGDTVLSVNGRPIERPAQALQVWNGLRVASELTVEYLRDGQTHQLRFAIVDASEPAVAD